MWNASAAAAIILPLQCPRISDFCVQQRRPLNGNFSALASEIPSPLPVRVQAVALYHLRPNFRILHSRRYPTSSSFPAATGLFLSRIDDELNFISFNKDDLKSMGIIASRLNSFRVPFHDVVDTHSCNGLHCICFGERKFFVHNPTTNQYRRIPTSPGSKTLKKPRKALQIVFDPLKSQYYKLVRLWCRLTDLLTTEIGFSIYCSKTGVWRDTTDIIKDENFYPVFRRGVLYNGELHWVSNEYSFSFDMNKERLNSTKYPFPTDSGHWNCIRYFAECGGCLVATKFNDGENKLKVLQFENDHSRWLMKYDVDFAPLYTLYAAMGSDFWTDFQILYLSVEKEEKEKKGKLVILLRNGVISYEIGGMIIKEIVKVEPCRNCKEDDTIYYGWMHAYQHVETLFNA